MWPKVNRALLPMKGHYFLFNAGTAPVQPFMPVYAKQQGFSSVVVGTIYSILPVTGMLAKPFFGAIADRLRLHKFIFLLFQIVTIIAFFSIQFIPEIPQENSKFGLVCGTETHIHMNTSNIKDMCLINKIMSEADSAETINCSMECDLNSQLQNEICYGWNATIPICYNNRKNNFKNIISENSTITKKMNKLRQTGKVAYSEKSHSLQYNESPLKVKSAMIPKKHILLDHNTMYFKVSTVFLDGDVKTHVPYCAQKVHTKCTLRCNDTDFNNLLASREENISSDFATLYQFWLFLMLLIGSWVGMAVVSSVSDAICFEILGAKANLYGNQRLWGSIGWGIFAFLAGFIVDEISRGQIKKDYTPIFYIMLIMLSFDVACSYSLKYEQTKLSTEILKNVGQLLKNLKVLLFLLWCIFIGLCIGIQWNFLFWYVESLGNKCETETWIKTLQGLVSGVQCFLGELPSFFASGWILKKFQHVHVMSGILVFIGIRFILYSFLTNPWWVLPIEILQATVGLSFATMASYASIVAPPGTEATVQGLVGAVFEGIGVSLGSFLGGFFFYNYGGSTCFKIFGIASLVGAVLHAGTQYLLNKTAGFKLNGKGNYRAFNSSDEIEGFNDSGLSTDSSMETMN